MIYTNGDITAAPEKYIAHGCNAQGVMGSGVALAIRNKWPQAYLDYIRFIRENAANSTSRSNLLGLYTTTEVDGKIICNLITQQFFGSDGRRYADPTAIANALVGLIWDHNIAETIAIPKIGCGLGGLNWDADVLPILRHLEQTFPVTFNVYEI